MRCRMTSFQWKLPQNLQWKLPQTLKQQSPVAPPGLLWLWFLVAHQASLLCLMADDAKEAVRVVGLPIPKTNVFKRLQRRVS